MTLYYTHHIQKTFSVLVSAVQQEAIIDHRASTSFASAKIVYILNDGFRQFNCYFRVSSTHCLNRIEGPFSMPSFHKISFTPSFHLNPGCTETKIVIISTIYFGYPLVAILLSQRVCPVLNMRSTKQHFLDRFCYFSEYPINKDLHHVRDKNHALVHQGILVFVIHNNDVQSDFV